PPDRPGAACSSHRGGAGTRPGPGRPRAGRSPGRSRRTVARTWGDRGTEDLGRSARSHISQIPYSVSRASQRSMAPMLTLDIDLRSLPKEVSPPDHWQERAACYGLDPEVFFPTTEDEAGLALSYCAACPVRNICLAWAVRNG